MSNIKKLKDILLDESYKYVNEMEQKLPVDENGNVLIEYLSYFSLNSIHNLMASMSKDMSVVIIKETEEDKDYVNAFVESSFHLIPDDTMEKILELIKKIESKTPVKLKDSEGDINITA